MLLSPSLLIVALLSALNLAHASPTPPTPTNLALTCTPNFSGRAQTIVVAPGDPVYAWTPNSIFPGAHITLQRTSSTGQAFKFLVQFTGRADASFVLRLEAETNRYTALTAWRGSDLAFDILALASHPSQQFTITCQSCLSSSSSNGTGTARAQGCTIAHPASGSCIAGSTPGETLRLAGCSAGAAGVYSFWD